MTMHTTHCIQDTSHDDAYYSLHADRVHVRISLVSAFHTAHLFRTSETLDMHKACPRLAPGPARQPFTPLAVRTLPDRDPPQDSH